MCELYAFAYIKSSDMIEFKITLFLLHHLNYVWEIREKTVALNWRLLIYSEWVSTFIYLSLEIALHFHLFVEQALKNMEKWMDWKWNWNNCSSTVVNNGIACGSWPGHHPRKLTTYPLCWVRNTFTKANWNRIFRLTQVNFRFSSILQCENIDLFPRFINACIDERFFWFTEPLVHSL